MKLPFFFALALLVTSCASTPRKFAPPSTTGVHSRISETRGHIDNAGKDAKSAKASIAKARELGKGNAELIAQLDGANVQIDSLTQSLLAAQGSTTDAEAKLTEADGKTRKMTDEINKREVRASLAINRYHRLKFWCCTIGAALVGLVVFQFRGLFLALGPYGIAAMVAVPVAAWGLLWWFL